MKRFVIITAAVMVISGLIGLILLGRTGVNFPLGAGELKLRDTKTGSIAAIEKVEIETISENVNIIKTTDPNLKADLMLADQNDEAKLVIAPDASGKTLQIKIDRKNKYVFWSHSFAGELNVYLPETYTGDLSVKSISGRVSDSDLSGLKNVKMETTSGRIELDDKAGSQESLELKTVSGRIEAKNLAAFKSVTASTTSGRIELYNLSGQTNASSVSGRIELAFDSVLGGVKAKTTSGQVELSLPNAANATISFETVSGGFSSSKLNVTRSTRTFHQAVIGNGANKIEVETVSGGLSVE